MNLFATNSLPVFLSLLRKLGLVLIFLQSFTVTGQQARFSQLEENTPLRSLAINPVKPFLGLFNAHFEYQLTRGVGLPVFSEYLAFDFARLYNHPDLVSRVGVNFYPAFRGEEINQKLFIGVNLNYIIYLRDPTETNTFAPGLEMGYKKFIWQRLFIASRASVNYNPVQDSFLPGFEALVGFVF